MSRLTNSLTDYLTRNNSWILVVMITFIVFKWVLNVIIDNGPPMIYLHYEKWILFFKTTGVLLLIFSPIILFTHFKNYFKENLGTVVFWLVSGVVLLGWPLVLGSTGISDPIMPVRMLSEVVAMNGLVLGVLSIATEPDGWLVSKMSFSNLSKVLTPNKLILTILFFLSIHGTMQVKMVNGETTPFLELWIQNLIVLALYYVFFRINHEYLIKNIFKQKGVVYYLFSFLGLMLLFYLPMVAIYYILPGFKSFLSYKLATDWVGERPQAFYAIFSATITGLMMLTIPLAILVEWFTQENKIDKLQGEQTETELSLLKQQINPHFFFNTLNNVYAMSLTKDEHTSEGILQLSDLMRYVIYKGQEKAVFLSEEVKYIEDFLELQKLRLHKNLDLQFEKTVEDEEISIPPLLFIILVENAFKHGIEGAEGDSYLHLHLIQDKSKLVFSCKNSLEKGRLVAEPGLGLTNLKRRLELLYPDKHKLEIEEYPDSYRAVLTIDL